MQVLSLENYKYFLQEIKKAGCLEENLSICLDGEPFMNKYMCDFIEIANREGFLPTFGSNGRLLTREIIDRIKECRFRAAIDFSSISRRLCRKDTSDATGADPVKATSSNVNML